MPVAPGVIWPAGAQWREVQQRQVALQMPSTRLQRLSHCQQPLQSLPNQRQSPGSALQFLRPAHAPYLLPASSTLVVDDELCGWR